MRECRNFQRLLSRQLDGELSPAGQQVLAGHLAGCGRCRQVLDAMQQDRRLLAALSEVEPPPYLLARVMAEVRRRQMAPARGLTLVRVLRAAAAVLLVVASAGSGVLLGSSIARVDLNPSGNREELLMSNMENGTVDVYSVAFGGE